VEAKGFALVQQHIGDADDDALETTSVAHRFNAPLVLIDGYHFGPEFQRTLRSAGLRVAANDPLRDPVQNCLDALINANIYANKDIYRQSLISGPCLLGPEFVSLRSEFVKSALPRAVKRADCLRILLSLGGSDPDSVTLKVAKALARLNRRDWRCTIVVGPGFSNPDALLEFVNANPSRFEIESTPENMAGVMCKADIALLAGGTTVWEALFVGLPVALVVVADNQLRVAEPFHQKRLAWFIGDGRTMQEDAMLDRIGHFLDCEELHNHLSESGPKCVDGNGAVRVASVLRSMMCSPDPSAWQVNDPSRDDVARLP